jgi:hypothetical protein
MKINTKSAEELSGIDKAFDEDSDETRPGELNITLGVSDHHGELRYPR